MDMNQFFFAADSQSEEFEVPNYEKEDLMFDSVSEGEAEVEAEAEAEAVAEPPTHLIERGFAHYNLTSCERRTRASTLMMHSRFAKFVLNVLFFVLASEVDDGELQVAFYLRSFDHGTKTKLQEALYQAVSQQFLSMANQSETYVTEIMPSKAKFFKFVSSFWKEFEEYKKLVLDSDAASLEHPFGYLPSEYVGNLEEYYLRRQQKAEVVEKTRKEKAQEAKRTEDGRVLQQAYLEREGVTTHHNKRRRGVEDKEDNSISALVNILKENMQQKVQPDMTIENRILNLEKNAQEVKEMMKENQATQARNEEKLQMLLDMQARIMQARFP